jgi:hypothetical protein
MAASISMVTATVTVNAAFLQEIKEVNAELWQLFDNLRHALGDGAGVREHAAQLADMLIELRDQLALHFALEEAYGYFDDPIAVVPAVAEAAARMRSEHRKLYSQISRVADTAEQLLYDQNLDDFATLVPAQFQDFDDQLQRHESEENELIMGQFDDIGVGD